MRVDRAKFDGMTPRRAKLLEKADRLVDVGNEAGCSIWLCQVTGPIRSLAAEIRRLDRRVVELEAQLEHRGLFSTPTDRRSSRA
jgi:hypothetical protein